jgi:group I intron endonuclease
MEANDKQWCVYKHTSPNGKVYIGITCQKPEKRWANGYGYNQVGQEYFWNAICKYGWENFEHEILYDNLTYDDAMQYEIDLIALYKSNYKRYGCSYGYNATDGGEGRRTPLSQETKNKISQSRIGRFIGENNPNYGNHKLAGENNPFYGKTHAEATKKKMSEARKNKPSPNKGKPMSDQQKEKISRARLDKKKVLQFDLDYHQISEYESLRQASDVTGYDKSNISACCNGKIKTSHGFIWRYKNSE